MPDFAFRDWKKDVLESAADRFERRLTEESGALRLDMASLRSDVRMEIGTLRTDMEKMNSSLVRWMFLFWIGQFGVTLTVIKMLT